MCPWNLSCDESSFLKYSLSKYAFFPDTVAILFFLGNYKFAPQKGGKKKNESKRRKKKAFII